MNNVAKIITGLVGAGLAYSVGKSIYYNSVKAKAKKSAVKMDIYNPNQKAILAANANDPMFDEIYKLRKDGNLVYMKPVKHNGKLIPCVMIKDKFQDLDINRWYMPFGNTKKDIYKQLFGSFCDPDYLKRSGGAFSSIIRMARGYGLFDEEGPLHAGDDSQLMIDNDGFISVATIIIDENLLDCGISKQEFESMIHHEYWHCACQGGYIEKILNNDPSLSAIADCGIINCPEEEIWCDAFAKENVGIEPPVGKIIDKYSKVSKSVSVMAKLKLLTEGRCVK